MKMKIKILIAFLLLIFTECSLRYKNSEYYAKRHRNSTLIETRAYLNALKEKKVDTILISDYEFKQERNTSYVYYQHNGEYFLKKFTLVNGRQTFTNPRARVKDSKVLKINEDKIFKYIFSNAVAIIADSLIMDDLTDHPIYIFHKIITNNDSLSFSLTNKQYRNLTSSSSKKQAIDSLIYFFNSYKIK
jgi:hypothetical protein